MTNPRKVVIFVLIFALLGLAPLASARFDDFLEFHEIETDQESRIEPWYASNLGQAYDHNIRLLWQFWQSMETCPNGVKYYLQHRIWKRNHDYRGLGADQVAMTLSSWNLLHQYLGDSAVKDDMIYMADYFLSHSLSPATDKWANVPYPYNLDVHSGIYDGDLQGGPKFFQPDKAGSFGAELILMYKLTGSRKYLDAATRIADTLAENVVVGDEENSPWPYRVHTKKNKVHKVITDGVVYRASYTTSWTGAIRLFDDLISTGEGRVADYQRARGMAIDWIKAYPLKTNKWGPFFEDISTDTYSDTESNADTMAGYILEHPDWDPDWLNQVQGILDWTLNTFGNRNWINYRVVPINEQTAFMVPGNSHTSRFASVELLLAEKTGDQSQKEDAIARLNWATYMVDEDGRNRYPEGPVWLTDGYGDYVRHYLRAMASSPDLAPGDQNHLLRTSSVVRNISYNQDAITYTKFDANSQERLKMGEWEPGSVDGGEMQWDPVTRVLNITATSKTVTISKRVPGAALK